MIQHLITDVSEDDFNVAVGGQVEIIGWLYQYYNTEPHDQVVNITGGPVKKADIPAATQLFTTDWVVKYMVDNSLGKYWLERHPESNLKAQLKFLLPSELEVISDTNSVEDLKIIDNAMGSGHILVYAFDVLMRIYAEQGYSVRDAAALILHKNLYGLEIDKRAYQLAYFALMMKARQYNRRALRSGKMTPNVFVFEDTDDISEEFMGQVSSDAQEDLADIVTHFSNARELGSIIHFDKQYDFDQLRQAVTSVSVDDLDIFGFQAMQSKLLRILRIAEVLCAKYDVVVTNPPYMNKMEPSLKKYVKKHYADYSGDLFSIFIFVNSNLVKVNGYAAFMTPFVWMFIKTYEKLRKFLIENKKIDSLIQMEYSAFEEATVPINTFVLKNTQSDTTGTYVKLSAFKGGMDVQKDRVLEAIAKPDIDFLYRTNQANFTKIPGMPIAYWIGPKTLKTFSEKLIKDFVISDGQTKTGNNQKYLRHIWEVTADNVGTSSKWVIHAKGGSFRRWYGNLDTVIDWSIEAKEHYRKDRVARIAPSYIWFRKGITWTLISSDSRLAVRLLPSNATFNLAAPSLFSRDITLTTYLLGFLNSKSAALIRNIYNPTLNTNISDITNIPFKVRDRSNVESIVLNNIAISKSDWDSYETSWDFTRHPLLTHIADDNLSHCRSPVVRQSLM